MLLKHVTLVMLFLFAVLMLTRPDISWSCSCIQSTLAEEFAGSSAVFSGTVLERKKDERKWQLKKSDGTVENVAVEAIYLVKFTVDGQWKGDLPKETAVITSAVGTACGFYFQRAARYLVYAYKDQNGFLSTSVCSSTKPYERASEDLQVLKNLSGK